MVKEILSHNSEKVARAVGRLNNRHNRDKIKKLVPNKRQLVKLPDISDVLPKRSVFLIKGAEKGDIITNTLRTKLEKNLRDTLAKYTAGGNKIEGRTGKLNTKLIQEFQSRIKETFEEYTKKDPKTGVPSNIKTIAVTETRNTIGMIKEEYNKLLLKKNPGSVIEKQWIHNRSLSFVPRGEHMKLHKKKLLFDEYFRVENKKGGVDLMQRPHDPSAPPEQTIGCNCDMIYRTVILKEL